MLSRYDDLRLDPLNPHKTWAHWHAPVTSALGVGGVEGVQTAR